MGMIEDFASWMRKTATLSESSIYKYSHAVHSISNDMIKAGVLQGSLFELNTIELDIYILRILNNNSFIIKNTIGNNMYSNSLKQFRLYRFENEINISNTEIENYLDINDNISETMKATIILARVGQGLFRKQLMEKYGGRCVVTKIDNPKLLLASHIKPWAVCSNKERLSVDNGLLLSPTYDRLFDAGLITFSQNGAMHISSQVSKYNRQIIGISDGEKYEIRSNSLLTQNLEYHQDVVFVR